MEHVVDSKRKSRNLSEKKRRDQFNNLINELNNLIDPQFDIVNSSHLLQNSDIVEQNDLDFGILDSPNPLNNNSSYSNQPMSASMAQDQKQKKMDKSSVLKCALDFLKKHSDPKLQYQQRSTSTNGSQKDCSNQNKNGSSVQLDSMEYWPPTYYQASQQENPQSSAQDPVATGLSYDGPLLVDDINIESCKPTTRTTLQADISPWKPAYITDDEFSLQMLEALDAFIVICEANSEARIIYSSDTLTNLLDYKGTCNSLRHHGYVSIFDLLAPSERNEIESLFKRELKRDSDPQNFNGERNINSRTSPTGFTSRYINNLYGTNMDEQDITQPDESPKNRDPFIGQLGLDECWSESCNEGDFISLTVRFRSRLDLTEIKQGRLRMRDVQFQQMSPVTSQNMSTMRYESQQPATQVNQQQLPNLNLCVNYAQDQGNSNQNIDAFMQTSTLNDPGDGQKSIAEQEKTLLSEDRRQQQEHNHMIHQAAARKKQKRLEKKQQRNSKKVICDQDIVLEQEVQQQQQHKSCYSQGEPPPSSTIWSTGDSILDSMGQRDAPESDLKIDGSNEYLSSNQDKILCSSSISTLSSSSSSYPQKDTKPVDFGSLSNPINRNNIAQNQVNANITKETMTTNVGSSHLSNQQQIIIEQAITKQITNDHLPDGQSEQYEIVKLMATFMGLIEGESTLERLVSSVSATSNDNANSLSLDLPSFDEKCTSTNQQVNYGSNSNAAVRYFICIGRLEAPRLSYDLKIIVPPLRGCIDLIHNNQFLSKHTLKWRFLWIDDRAPAIIGYLPFEVLGTSGYDYYHWDDLDKLVMSHEGLMRDGHASSGPYRFLTKGQQWIWLRTKYCIILKPQYYNDCKRSLAPNYTSSATRNLESMTDTNNKGSQLDNYSLDGSADQPQSLDYKRYERLNKSTEHIELQSIRAGNSLASRSLDQFRFILCTHTVIGFDESNAYFDYRSSMRSETNNSHRVNKISSSDLI